MHDYMLQKIRLTYKGEKLGRPKTDNQIHVTDLGSFCPRALAICLRDKIPYHTESYLPLGLSVTFEIGRMVQSLVVRRLQSAGVLWGSWKCVVCKKLVLGVRPTKCICGANLYVYQDTALCLDTYGHPVVGHVDAFMMYLNNLIIPVEVKSIKPDAFEVLTEPQPDHRGQLSHYLWMLTKKVQLPDFSGVKLSTLKFGVEKGVIIYVCKLQKKMPYKIFEVVPDPIIIGETEKNLNKFKRFTKSNVIPKRLCKNPGALLARKCTVRPLCFTK